MTAVAEKGISGYKWTPDGAFLHFDAHTLEGDPITVCAQNVAFFLSDTHGRCLITFAGGNSLTLLESADELRWVMSHGWVGGKKWEGG